VASPIRHVLNFSGGLASAYAAHRLLEREGRDGVVLLFADTKYEDEDLYRFSSDVERLLGLPLTRIADGRDPWQVLWDERFLGNSRVDPCSKILKRELLDRWTRANAPGAVRHVGIWWDERERLDRLQRRSPNVRWESPLLWRPWATEAKALAWLASVGVRRSVSYDRGFTHDNCGGRCVKQGQAGWGLLLRTRPDRFAECEAKEQAIRAELGDVSILVDRRGGQRRPLPLRVLRERIESTGQLFDPTDCATGCGCSIDDGDPELTTVGGEVPLG
jgi:hypothetical protein